jgi:DNA-directed RNA polymerase specialized sigma24 family protein
MQQNEGGQSIMTNHRDDHQRDREAAAQAGHSAAYFASLSVSDLARECADETDKFLKGGASDERAGLELFRRAVVRRDEYAWACLYRQYAPLVLTWVNQHQSAARVFGQDGPESLVNAAFAKFSQAVTPAKMEHFVQLAALLKYLKMCVHSIITDEVRARQGRRYEETLEIEEHDRAISDPAEGVVTNLAAQGLWQAILAELVGEEEQVLIYCAFVLGLKSTEITNLHHRLFPSVEDVYRIKRNTLERLRRNQRLLAFVRGSHGPTD